MAKAWRTENNKQSLSEVYASIAIPQGGGFWKNKTLPEIMKHKIAIGTKKAMAKPEVKAKYNKAMKDTPTIQASTGWLRLSALRWGV